MCPHNGIVYKGINYDVGTNYMPGVMSREVWNVNLAKQDMDIIRNELNCNAVSIYGKDINRLIECATVALESDLHVWLQPRLVDANQDDLLDYLTKTAKEAELLRIQYGNVTFNMGCEYSLFASGIIPGKNFSQRALMLTLTWWLIPFYNMKLNSFLKKAVSTIREHFHGETLYGAGSWESVDWSIFDLVGLNYYMDSSNASNYAEELRKFQRFNKPVVITEFGCCCFEGAAQMGGGGFRIIKWNKTPPRLKGHYTRNESVQSEYISNLLDIYEQENIYGAFVFSYMEPTNLFSPDPLYDLDMASYGIVTAYPKDIDLSGANVTIKPKKAFYEVAKRYKTIYLKTEG